MKKTIGIADHVDHQTSCLDTHSIEKARGITIFADQAVFSYRDDTYYLLDTPGHVDFSAETERAITAMDAAVLLEDYLEGGLQPETVKDSLRTLVR